METEWHGVFPYVPTPTTPSGEIDLRTLRSTVLECLTAGVHGVTPLGSSGEIAYLDGHERLQVVRATVECVDGRVPVVAGIAGFTGRALAEAAKAAVDVGSDGILLIPQSYFPLTSIEVFGLIEAVVNVVEVPVVLYNHARVTHTDLTEEIFTQAHEQLGVKHIKEASGELAKVSKWIDLASGDARVFSATAISPTSAMQAGAVGWMAGPASAFPGEAVRLYAACVEARWDDAYLLEQRMESALQVFRANGPARGVKMLLAACGRGVGQPRDPLEPFDERAVAEVREALDRNGLLNG